jgi:1,4-dihydroxy-2-naphthoate octaprenyltransferase
MANLLIYLKVVRIQTFAMSLFPIICAYSYANFHYSVRVNGAFVLVAISAMLFHLATNTISEYRDFRNGIDDVHSPDTKYRLVSGIVRPNAVLLIGLIAFSLASILGIVAVFVGTKLLLIPGIISAGIAIFYSEQPFGLKYKALGELCVFMIYGP